MVGKDSCVPFERLHWQLPQDQHRYHYLKAKLKVVKRLDGTIAIYHGSRRLERYTATGKWIQHNKENRQVA